MKRFCLALCVLIIGAVSFSSCIKKDFDTPPDQSKIDPNLPVNMTIAQLSAMALYYPNGMQITGDSIIYGVVTADDKSGNFYKQIVIQDSTGAIVVQLAQYSLYTDYPIGRKIYIKVKDLFVGSYKGVPELGYAYDLTGSMVGIPSTLIPNYLVKATFPNTVTPAEVTLEQINLNPAYYINRLVKIDSVEFQTKDANQIYASPSIIASGTSRTLEDCSGSTLVVYSSGFASFQPYLTPGGKGSITGIYSVYTTSGQFLIRDTTDLVMHGTRCDGTTGDNGNGTSSIISLDSVRKMYNGADVKLGSVKITGIVTLSADSGTELAASVVLQDHNSGISVYYGNASGLHYGDSVVMDLTGSTLSSYKGSLEIKYPTATNTVGTKKTVTPRVITIADLNAQYTTLGLEYTVVSIANATVTGGGTYNGNKTLTDPSGGSITLYSPSTVFGGQSVPTTPATFTAVVSFFNTGLELEIEAPSISVH